MKLMSILSGKGFVMYNKEIARSVSVNAAIIFGQLCSSYESFASKGMLTIRDNKEYFFLTSETLEEETALSYKQQLKAIKELEQAGYIETKVMGVPAKKYFHITNKIAMELLSELDVSSDKREDLNVSTISEAEGQKVNPSLSKKETLVLPKENDKSLQKGSDIKNKNKKEQYKDKNNYIVNKKSVNNEEIIQKLTNEYRIKGLSKDVCLRVVDEVLANNDEIHNFEGYLRTCLENALYKSKLKRGKIDLTKSFRSSQVLFYNWLEDDNNELPY